jgi:hypothetical protein
MTGSELSLPNTVGFFTPRAYDAARINGIVSMEPDIAAITRIGEITADVSPEFALPVASRGLTIVLRGGHTEYLPHRWDGHFRDAGITQNYVGFGGLEAEDPLQPPSMTKAQIQQLGHPLLELTLHTFDQPLGPAMAATILGGFQHPNQRWAAFGTLTDFGRSPVTNVKRVRAVKKVTDEGLQPFIIRRAGDAPAGEIETT